ATVATDARCRRVQARRHRTESCQGRTALLPDAAGRIHIEGRRSHRHGHDPLAAGLGPREPADHGLNVGDRAAARERRIDIFQALTVEMGVSIDETGHDRGATQIRDVRPAIAQPADLAVAADGDDTVADDRERGRPRASRIERDDATVDENAVGRYFIHPFSRYARSAPGWSRMPTLSGCHAVVGSNWARPAWPRTSASLLSTTVFVTV